MSAVDAVRALYEAYIGEAERLERNRKPGDGLMGLSAGPKDDPCHDRFADDLKRLLRDIRAQEPSSGEVREMLSYIYHAPLEHPQPLTVYWMLKAVHGLTVDLAGLLAPADAQCLRDAYVKDYRRWDRLPSQKQALCALDSARKA